MLTFEEKERIQQMLLSCGFKVSKWDTLEYVNMLVNFLNKIDYIKDQKLEG